MEVRTDDAAKTKLFDLVKEARFAMMATRGPFGTMHARPMATHHTEFDGTLWFLTDASAATVQDLEADDEVLLTYADPGAESYVSISGRGTLVRDRAVTARLWSEPVRAWFPKGPDDPDLAAIRVDVDLAEYWDGPSGTMMHVYGYLKAAATGEWPEPGENTTIRFD